MKKKKVLHILNTGLYSGAENVAITIIKGLSPLYDCYYVSPKGEISEILKKNQIRHISVNTRNIWSLCMVVNKLKPDLIHAHDFTTSILAACLPNKIPIISHIHNNPQWIKKYNMRSFAYYLSSIRYKKILIVSDAIQEEYIFGNQIKQKLEMISNPIDILKIQKLGEKEVNAAYDIVFCGRLTQQKNPMRFIRLINKLIRKNKTFTVAILGRGELEQELKQYIDKHSLQNNVQVFGFVKNPFPIIRQSKIMCMTSDWEGFGLVAIEALALGTPVLATPVGGLPGIINYECGMLCKTDNDFLNEMQRLLSEPNYYEQKKQNALKQAESLDNIYEYLRKMQKIYDDIL